MRKEKKIKSRKQEKKTLYILGGILGVFLISILLLNARSAFKKMETRDCVINMSLMGEGMLQMRKEFRFDVPSTITTEELAETMAYYFHFGSIVFENPTTGTLALKPKEDLVNLPLTERKGRYILDIPTCPSKGRYTLLPSRENRDLFDIQCSVHGRLYLPGKDKKYLFTGDIDALGARKTDLGREADLYFSLEEIPKEFITIIPYSQVTPTPTPKSPSTPGG
jgi:hypothetical protein